MAVPCACLNMQEEIARLKAELQARQQAGGPEVHGNNQASIVTVWHKSRVEQVKSYWELPYWLVHAAYTCPAVGAMRAGLTKQYSNSARNACNGNCKQLHNE